MALTAYKKTGLTGGASTDLDGIDGSSLEDGDFAFVTHEGKLYFYLMDADGGAGESSPDIIVPDNNAGTMNWILQSAPNTTISASDPATDTNPNTTGHYWINKTSGECYICTDATTDENVWTNIGDGTGNIEPFSYGPGDDYDAMVTAGNYDSGTDTGYMGLVTSADLCSGTDLAGDIGLTDGSDFNNTTGWLKFWVGADADCNKDNEDKIVFIAKETLRYNLDWDSIYNAGAVYGTGDNGVANSGSNTIQDAEVTYDGNDYKVRLLTGADDDPATHSQGSTDCADNAGSGSEWNDLLYRVHNDAPDCGNPSEGIDSAYQSTYHGGAKDGANWTNFSDADLQVHHDAGNGSYSWCQEQGANTSRRVRRGSLGVAFFHTITSSYSDSSYGWRPVLQLIQP